MTQQISKYTREYPDFDRDGKEKVLKVTYTIFKQNGVIKDIRNEYGCSIEKNSECWEFITNTPIKQSSTSKLLLK